MSDLIERAAAIDAINKAFKRVFEWDGTEPLGGRVLKDVPAAQPPLDEWCDDCKEYDSEKHCCPRLNRVIRQTAEDMKAAQPTQTIAESTQDFDKDTNVPSNDCISRQAAIDAVYYAHGTGMALKAIKQLPSAQPEIIRCKECKHSEHWYRDKRRCFLWVEDGIDVFDDGFCNYAERRTDE